LRINLYRFLTSELFISFFYRLVLLYSWTFRLKIENDKGWMEYRKNGGVVLLCTWHQQFFSAVRPFKNYKIFNPSIMISQSRDGEIVAKMALRNGWNPVRGSSSNGGMGALKKMITNLKEKKLAAHIVDGPKGPSGTVKAGTIRLAHAADAVIAEQLVQDGAVDVPADQVRARNPRLACAHRTRQEQTDIVRQLAF